MAIFEQPITEDEFFKVIWLQFRHECKMRGVEPSREVFQEALDTDPFFAEFIERCCKKFRFAASHKQIVDRCINSIH